MPCPDPGQGDPCILPAVDTGDLVQDILSSTVHVSTKGTLQPHGTLWANPTTRTSNQRRELPRACGIPHAELVIYLFIYLFLFLDFFFLMWTVFKVFTEFVTILLLFYVLVFWLQGMWELSSPTRDQTCTPPCIGR